MSAIPVPTWKTTRSQPAARPQLSRDLIVETAVRILDQEGLDGVSMRRVADELGTGAASLYAHVANKDELLDLVHDRVVGELDIPEPDPAHWQDQLRQMCRSMLAVYARHRDIAVVTFANIPTGPNALRCAEGMLSILIGGGVPPKQAAWALDRIALHIAADAYEGSIIQKRQEASGLSQSEFIDHFVGDVRDFFTSLPDDEFPMIKKYLPEMMAGDGTDRFEFGVDMIIRSLESYVHVA